MCLSDRLPSECPRKKSSGVHVLSPHLCFQPCLWFLVSSQPPLLVIIRHPCDAFAALCRCWHERVMVRTGGGGGRTHPSAQLSVSFDHHWRAPPFSVLYWYPLVHLCANTFLDVDREIGARQFSPSSSVSPLSWVCAPYYTLTPVEWLLPSIQTTKTCMRVILLPGHPSPDSRDGWRFPFWSSTGTLCYPINVESLLRMFKHSWSLLFVKGLWQHKTYTVIVKHSYS